MATSPGDSTRITLLQALYSDLGPFFHKVNLTSLVQFAFNYTDCETTASVSCKGSKGSGKDKGSSLRATSSSALLHQISLVSRLLKLTHAEKLTLLICVNEHHSFSTNSSIKLLFETDSDSHLPSDCSIEDTFLIDLTNSNFSTSHRHLGHLVVTSLASSSDPLAQKALNHIIKQFRSSDTIDDDTQILLTPFLTKSNQPVCSVTMSTATAPMSSLSEEQLASMLISQSTNGVIFADQLKNSRITVTPGLCAKLLFQLCANGTPRQPTDIEALANICREFLVNSASPLSDVIAQLDCTYFLPYNDRVINLKTLGKPFSRFWHFCINLCNTEKQGNLSTESVIVS